MSLFRHDSCLALRSRGVAAAWLCRAVRFARLDGRRVGRQEAHRKVSDVSFTMLRRRRLAGAKEYVVW